MALNKSIKSTPSSRSGYFSELTASVGKQSQFLLPVRIKVTPNTTMGPLSDGKKNPGKMLQPVLIKDLLHSNKKDRRNSTIMSVSTQKKKNRTQRLTQPFLNTQSCHKPKQEAEESSFFGRKSYAGSKVRRQLYQNLDSPQKSALEDKSTKNNTKPKKKLISDFREPISKNTSNQNKNRKSFLLPPNSIKNHFVRKSATMAKPSSKENVKANSVLNKNFKSISHITETNKLKMNITKNVSDETEDEFDIELHLSSPEADKHDSKQPYFTVRDNYTMTSPTFEREIMQSKSVNHLERPSVIMSPSKVESRSVNVTNNVDPLSSEMQNLSVCKTPNHVLKGSNDTSNIQQNTRFNFEKMINLDRNSIVQLKLFLEQSIQACEDQASKLKQILGFVNNMFSDTVTSLTKTNENEEKCKFKKCNSFNSTMNNQDGSTITEMKQQKKKEVEEILSIPIKNLISDQDLNQESKEAYLDIVGDIARLSTIGEVSCEDDLNKDEKEESEKKENLNNHETKAIDSYIVKKDQSDNKENVSNLENNIISSSTVGTPKTPRRRTITAESCDSHNRRRSARLAAKQKSLSILSDSDTQDSFTQLENELNVVHPSLSSKSLPASPMQPPLTPGVVKQWDKRVERPLKEYMALKMNGTFLVTPDIKKFQSHLGTTDTPHSRKSLSRKIFMELCDLYAESPEHK